MTVLAAVAAAVLAWLACAPLALVLIGRVLLAERRAARTGLAPEQARDGGDGLWQDPAPAPDPDPAPDAVDEAAEQAIALLTPDALPSCRCEVCADLSAEAVDDVLAEIAEDFEADVRSGLYDVDRAADKLLPPSPPIIPGHPDREEAG